MLIFFRFLLLFLRSIFFTPRNSLLITTRTCFEIEKKSFIIGVRQIHEKCRFTSNDEFLFYFIFIPKNEWDRNITFKWRNLRVHFEGEGECEHFRHCKNQFMKNSFLKGFFSWILKIMGAKMLSMISFVCLRILLFYLNFKFIFLLHRTFCGKNYSRKMSRGAHIDS